MDRLEQLRRALRSGRDANLSRLEGGVLDLPEIRAMVECDHGTCCRGIHLEGSVWAHTMLAYRHLPEDASLRLRLAVLLHDVGKPPTKAPHKSGRGYCYYSHDKVGAEMVPSVLERLGVTDSRLIDDVAWLVRQHMRVRGVLEMRPSKREALYSHPLFEDLLVVLRCDDLGAIPARPSFGPIEEDYRRWKASR